MQAPVLFGTWPADTSRERPALPAATSPSSVPPAAAAEALDLRLEGAGTIDAFGDEGDYVPALRGEEQSATPAPGSTLTYEPYYGLHEKPFSLSPDPRFLYRSASHEPVLHDLAAAIRRREGLVVLTGDIGTGKTTLCRAVIDQLDQKTFATFVPDPFLTREDLLKTMLVDFGVMSVDDLVKGRLKGASRPDLSFPLYEFLRSLEPLDAFAVLVIDEVQNLSLPLLEEIRILSDLEAGRKLLQVVLVGQPEFDDHLRLPRMRQVQQRVSVHCQLQPLDRDSVTRYVSHRLVTAGATPDRIRLLPAALDLVHAASGGVPRIINLLCDKALAHGQAQGTERIGEDLVRLAMADMRMTVPEAAPPAPPPADRSEPAPLVAAPARREGVRAPRANAPDDDSLARLDLPAAAAGEEAAGPASRAARALPSSAPSLARGKVWRGTRGLRPATAAALMMLGLTTGVSLMGYWLWVRPIWTSSIDLPPVARPAMAVRGVGPLVLQSRSTHVASGETVADTQDERAPSPPIAEAASNLTWAVQVGVFGQPSGAASVVSRLESMNYPAFERDLEFGDKGRFRVAFAGPYRSREAAAAALEALRRLPGFESAVARPLAP